MANAKCVLATGISWGKYTAAAAAAFCTLELAWKLTGSERIKKHLRGQGWTGVTTGASRIKSNSVCFICF